MVITHIDTVQQGELAFKRPIPELPEGSPVYVTIQPVMDELTACKKANKWLRWNIGQAGTKKQGELLEVDSHLVWRFEVFITNVGVPPIGPIGRIDLEAVTGEVLAPDQTVTDLMEKGHELASLS